MSRVFAWSLIIVLSIALPALPSLAQAEVVCEESFDSENIDADKWIIAENMSVESGMLKIQCSLDIADAGWPEFAIYDRLFERSSGNIVVEVDIKHEESAIIAPSAILLFGAGQMGQKSIYAVGPWQFNFYVWNWGDDVIWGDPEMIMFPMYIPKKTFALKLVILSSGGFEAYVDERKVYASEKGGTFDGYVMLGNGWGTAYFDNFKITVEK